MIGHGTIASNRRDKAILIAFVLVWLALRGVEPAGFANPAQAPRRIVNGFAVDISPLCTWWTNHEGPRPLISWVHVTGAIVGTNSGAWVIEARVDHAGTSPSQSSTAAAAAPERARILLRNPPIEDLAKFERLRSRAAQLNRARAGLIEGQFEAKAAEQAVNEQQRASRHNRATARVLATEDKRLKKTENQARTAQKPIDQELKDIKNSLADYPKLDEYVVDCFALDLQYGDSALPVYDHGQIPQ